MMEVPFRADESVYTFMSRYLDLYFLRRDLSNPEWDARVAWSVTQPPVPKYVIGLALFATGRDSADLHPPWNWGQAFLRRATADAPLVFFRLLAVVSSMKLLDSLSIGGFSSSRRPFAWPAMAGLWVGLAGGNKPSGAALTPMLLVAPLVAWLVGRLGSDAAIAPQIPLRVLALYAVLLTALVFVVPNPMLYENPMESIEAMIDYRVSAANTQQREAPEDALITVSDRARALGEGLFDPLGLVAFICVLALVVWQELRYRTRHTVTARSTILSWIGGTLALTAFFTPMNWGHYIASLVPYQAVVLGGPVGAAVAFVRQRRRDLDWSPIQGSVGDNAHLFDLITFDLHSERPATSEREPSLQPSLGHESRGEDRTLVLIPAHNEEQSLGSVLSQVRKHLPSTDILVIDDGSTDDTVSVARQAGAFAVSLAGNLGIGAAVQTGYILAHQMGYLVVARVDADGQHNPAVLPKLIASLERGNVDVIVGSRYLERSAARTSFPRRVGSRLLGWLISAAIGQKVTDPTSGMQVVNRDALAFCASYYPYDYPEPESRVLLHRAGFKVKEVPVIAAPRVAGRSSIGVLDSAYYMVRVTVAILIELLRPPRRERKRDAES